MNMTSKLFNKKAYCEKKLKKKLTVTDSDSSSYQSPGGLQKKYGTTQQCNQDGW